MTRSMTAFARAEHGAATWEIRSVNHRYLDVSFKMPDNLRHMETDLKASFKDLVHRGKVECQLRINASELQSTLIINEELLAALTEALGKVQALTGMSNQGDALSLLKWPDVMRTETSDDALVEDVRRCFKQAVTQMTDMRAREGAELAGMIETRLRDIEATVMALREEIPGIIQSQQEKLRKRLDDIKVEADPLRLEQELVMLAQKQDVDEELDRLATHVIEVRRNLGLQEPVGRRLDFLMQELNREANTLSSKASAASTTSRAVDLKVFIEQMREQIQNIE